MIAANISSATPPRLARAPGKSGGVTPDSVAQKNATRKQGFEYSPEAMSSERQEETQ